MKNLQQGYAAGAIILALAVIGVIGGTGYYVYHRNHDSLTNSSADKRPKNTGITYTIEDIANQEQANETAIDNRHSTADQATTQGTDTAARDLGGAYDESAL